MRGHTDRTPKTSNVVAFPLRPKANERSRLQQSSTTGSAVPGRPVIYDGAWYHDEAIAAEAERDPKREH